MSTVTYDGDIGPNMWAEWEVDYHVDKGYVEYWEGRPYNVPTQIHIERARCLCIEGWDSEGNSTYYRNREDLRGWESDLDAICLRLMRELVDDCDYAVDFLLENV